VPWLSPQPVELGNVCGEAQPAPVRDIDLVTYLRPSRFAATEFAQYADSATLLERVSSWVGTRLNYVPGSSDPIDGAADTLRAGVGVCRDYAHLVIAFVAGSVHTGPPGGGVRAGV
jgi:transglutaminase-like putative cysteine protease